MGKRIRQSKSTICIIIVFVTLVPLVLSQTNFVGSCFTTISDLNNEMIAEKDRIINGGIPESTYTYVLCSNTFFDTSNITLQPLLDNTIFTCGGYSNSTTNSKRYNNCVLIGGKEQVIIQDSTIPGYAINLLSFIGITFTGFQTSDIHQGTSIVASASSSTTAKFIDVAWQVRCFSKQKILKTHTHTQSSVFYLEQNKNTNMDCFKSYIQLCSPPPLVSIFISIIFTFF
jgi:hypothetical protein